MTPIFLLATLCLGMISAAPTHDPSFDTVWEEWKTKHGKTYNTNEEGQKRAVWENNMKMINLHNEDYLKGKHGFSLEMNAFGDLTNTEFRELMTGFQSMGPKETTIFREPFLGDIPKSLDWREHGYVTPVKNQGQCGSCWAFSAVGSLEGQIFKKTGKLVSLSEQNLVDCSWSYGNLGCNGGLMEFAFQYVKENRGLDTGESYAYEAQDGLCRYNPKYSAANVTGFVKVPLSEDDLMSAVASVGPVSVGIDSHHQSFRFYSGGMYYEPDCSSTEMDHAVLVVGYGEESDGGKYWLVKNSWGEDWGMDGYIKMAKDQNNNCGIATYAIYPTV
ncbi:rCG24278 [Rattus norvegicus]|uniref:Cathepsin L-like 3 n=2 Tax=Rattus norvegicus TaxID=10116 RepID=D3ZKC3_RAT|nr:procathepsin L [Rattus norvegicus]EDL93863.1 rCG24278 [Rattus norvegicus]|eukprot:XP_225137.5 PREDICTED: cathepsin L1 [Rattus norvegicus]